MLAALRAQFQQRYGHPPAFVARAPGRIEFIGNHTDYNLGTVLGAAIDRSVWVALRPVEADRRTFASEATREQIVLPVSETSRQTGAAGWVNYPLGVAVGMPEFGLRAPGGFEYLAMSDLPAGAGLSSSAALELASALVYLAATGQTPPRETVVKLGRHAENHFVGVPCGILDQGVSGFGKKDRLVFIDCRGPAFDTTPLPAGATFWIFNTHTKHALVDSLYATRHRECMEAARALGVAALADVTPDRLAREAGKLDPVLLRRARHVVEEIARVAQVRAALARGDLTETGRALSASHESSRTLFENSTPELDLLVEELRKQPHVHGARLTGGGFGGAVLALTSPEFASPQAEAVAAAYERRYGKRPEILRCATADGAELISN